MDVPHLINKLVKGITILILPLKKQLGIEKNFVGQSHSLSARGRVQMTHTAGSALSPPPAGTPASRSATTLRPPAVTCGRTQCPLTLRAHGEGCLLLNSIASQQLSILSARIIFAFGELVNSCHLSRFPPADE